MVLQSSVKNMPHAGLKGYVWNCSSITIATERCYVACRLSQN